MRTLLLLFVILISFPNLLQAQRSKKACTPDTTFKRTGYSPEEFPPGIAGEPYKTVVQFKFPDDTVFSNITVPIDSFIIKEISGMPDGYTSDCNNPGCVYPGGSNGCVEITGNPVDSMIGNYVVSIKIAGYISNPFPYTDSLLYEVPYEVKEKENSSIQEANNFDIPEVWPQPASSIIHFKLQTALSGITGIELFDLRGRKLQTQYFNSSGRSSFSMNLNELNPGIYIYSITNAHYRYQGKLVKH